VAVEVIGASGPVDARVVEHPQPGREAGGFLLPVEDQRPRDDHQRRPGPLALLAPRLEEGQHHDRLPEPHVVGQATAEAEPAKEVEPADPFPLVGAELAREAGRRVDCGDAVEASQLVAGPGEYFVAGGLGLRGEERVQQTDLGPAESEVPVLRNAEAREDTVPLQPLLGKDKRWRPGQE